jgi:uncharacterized Zn finger protein
MVEIECPFCDGTSRMDVAAFRAEQLFVRCETCGVEVAITDPPRVAVALAA